MRFARDLTGLSESSSHTFHIAEGIREVRSGRRPGKRTRPRYWPEWTCRHFRGTLSGLPAF